MKNKLNTIDQLNRGSFTHFSHFFNKRIKTCHITLCKFISSVLFDSINSYWPSVLHIPKIYPPPPSLLINPSLSQK